MLGPLDRSRRDSSLVQPTTKELRDFIDPDHLLIQIYERLHFAKLVAPFGRAVDSPAARSDTRRARWAHSADRSLVVGCDERVYRLRVHEPFGANFSRAWPRCRRLPTSRQRRRVGCSVLVISYALGLPCR